MKKLISILLVLVMIFSVTALAAEPEHICAGTCDHEHEETAIEPRWQCSNHNLVPYNGKEYGASTGPNEHMYRTITGDRCSNSGCNYEWVTYGPWLTEGHTMINGMCLYCGYFG